MFSDQKKHQLMSACLKIRLYGMMKNTGAWAVKVAKTNHVKEDPHV